MKTTSAELLEYPALKELLGRYLASDGGRRLLETMEPMSDRAAIEGALAEVREAIGYLEAASQPQGQRGATSRPRFSDLPFLGDTLAHLAIEGAVLEAKQILDIFRFLDRATDLRVMLTASGGRFPRLGERAFRIADFRDLLRELGGKIDPDGSLSDNASVALHRIRRDMERQRREIEASLERFLKAHREDGILQEDFVTIRNDRFVVPVVSGQRRRVDGVIHGSSGTGQTLFMEPLETIGLNNDLVRLREEEQRETFRILQEMSGRLRGSREAMAVAAEEMSALEFVFAKADFAKDFRCAVPVFGDRISIEGARHPLLEDVLRRQRKSVVPVDLTLGGPLRMLLISGPNTGGKTVALKTVGLLALMAHSGLPVPAARAEFPVFESVLAELGDHQSIEQSLSSFSSHVQRVREVLIEVTSDSLVLLDELGRATDPEEGGALAVAVLEQLRGWNAFVLASTHLTAPKVYGATTDGVLNAAMSFDEETLAPTYHLRTGAPGASAGLQIAERLGMPKHVIQAAKDRMTHQQQDLSRLLQLLEVRLEEASKREQELKGQRDALAAEQAQLAQLWEKRETAKLAELEQRTEALVADFKTRANEMLDRIEQKAEGAVQRKLNEETQLRVAQMRREIGEQFAAAVKSPGAAETKDLALAVGMQVRLSGVRQPARIKRLLGNGRIEVEAGFLKMQVEAKDVLEVLSAAAAAKKLPSNVTFEGADVAAQREINVIGQRADEALDAVDRFLDQAALASLDRVRIVHGHGMGVLKRAIGELLTKHPLVARYEQAPQGEGGAGATLVEMRN
jgi:DNA mismatch repair protein MutS2